MYKQGLYKALQAKTQAKPCTVGVCALECLPELSRYGLKHDISKC
ncbi:MAG: hypothetical protein ACI9GE_000158 [Oceanospirillaceae bacterium]|jgi:hypothetical protein